MPGKSKATSQQTESLSYYTLTSKTAALLCINTNEHLNLIRKQGQNWLVLMCHLNAKSHFSVARWDFAFFASDLQRQRIRALEQARHVHALGGDGKSVCLKKNFMSRTLTQIFYSFVPKQNFQFQATGGLHKQCITMRFEEMVNSEIHKLAVDQHHFENGAE